MPQIQSCKVMWELEDGTELGIAIPLHESDTDQTLIMRGWEMATAWVSPELQPKSKSDLRVVRRKKKK